MSQDRLDKIDKFLEILDDHIVNKVADNLPNDYEDSCFGFSSISTEEKLRKAFADLFDI